MACIRAMPEYQEYIDTKDQNVVPEPSTFVLFGIKIIGLVAGIRKKSAPKKEQCVKL